MIAELRRIDPAERQADQRQVGFVQGVGATAGEPRPQVGDPILEQGDERRAVGEWTERGIEQRSKLNGTVIGAAAAFTALGDTPREASPQGGRR